MREVLTAVLMLVGAFLMFVAGVGIVRLPDLFMRMSATTKAATLGAGLTLLAAAVYFDELGVTSRVLATIVFVLLTAPVAAQLIGRAGYFSDAELWEGTVVDELAGRYDVKTHVLASRPVPPEEAERPHFTPD